MYESVSSMLEISDDDSVELDDPGPAWLGWSWPKHNFFFMNKAAVLN